MPKKQPFNEYGQILAEGGERSVALLLAAGRDETQVERWLSDRYPGITPETRIRVISAANRGLQAGRDLSSVATAEQLPLGIIPLEPDLFGDTPAGRRIEATAALLSEDGKPVFRVDLDLIGDESIGEIIEEAIAKFNELRENYPGDAARILGTALSAAAFRIIYAARKF